MNEYKVTREQILNYEYVLRQEDYADATIEKYLRNIRAFADWLGDREVTKESGMQWREYLLENNRAPSTVNVSLCALNGLFRFLGIDCRIKFVRVQRRVFCNSGRELTKSDYKRLTGAAQNSGNQRLSLLMETICATGIRVSEVKYITIEAVQNGCARISMKGKIRTILLPARLRRKLLRYSKKQRIESGELFITKKGTGISRRQIWSEMKKIAASAGVGQEKVFPHNLRHLFAVTYYGIYKDVVRLADILGHSSVETTRLYLLTSGKEHQQQLDRLGLVS